MGRIVEHGLAHHITAFEHQELPITTDGSETSLSAAEADVLMHLAETRPGFCDRRYRSIRLAQYCGVVNLGHRVLEILPKVGAETDAAGSRGVLLRLLRAAATHEPFQSLPAAQQLERSPLLDIFISLFMDSVTALVRGGLLRQYTQRDDDLRVVRGRIVLNRQFGVHFNRPDVIASRYDDHTADNTWNRWVKAALRACRPWIVSGDLHRRWIELMAAFEDVADVVPSPAQLDRLVFDRQAARYRGTMEWVRWILALLSPALRAGVARAPAFLFDMNVVFEQAVANVLRRRMAESHPAYRVRAQASGRHLAQLRAGSRRAYGLRPDILVTEGRIVHIVADTKWKRVEITRSGHAKPARADMYQMHAYASAFGVERLVLIHPGHAGTAAQPETAFLLPPSGSRQAVVHLACVDVSRDDLPIVTGVEALLPASESA